MPDPDTRGPSAPGDRSSGDARPLLVLASGSRHRSTLLARLGLPFRAVAADLDETPLAGETPAALVRRLGTAKARAIARTHPGTLVIGSDQTLALMPETPDRRDQPGDHPGEQAGDQAGDLSSGRTAGQTADQMSDQTSARRGDDPHDALDTVSPYRWADRAVGTLGKPGTPEAARDQLATLAGRRLLCLTSLTVIDARSHPDPERAPTSEDLDVTLVSVRTLDAGEIERYVARDDVLDCAGAFRVESLGIALFDHVRSDDPTALIGLPLLRLAARLRERGLAVP